MWHKINLGKYGVHFVMFIDVAISLSWPELLFRCRELLLGADAYITSDNALHAPKKWSGHVSETIVWNFFVWLRFTVNL